MKSVMIVIILLLALPVVAEDMQKYLSDTREMVRQKKYEEALERFLWFHDHALEHQPSMYGVRLSFALMYWKELGDQYPAALAALEKVRDDKTARLESGDGNQQLFHDVMSINETLGESQKTVELFRKLDAEQARLAETCWSMAQDAVIEAKAYDLARKYVANPVREFAEAKARYDRQIGMCEEGKIDGSMRAWSEKNLVKEALQLIEVAVALNDMAAAKEIQKQALAVVDDYRLRDAIPSDKPQRIGVGD